jgi:hypothetical protein
MFDYIVNNFLLFFVLPFIALLTASGIVITFLDFRRLKRPHTTIAPVLGRDQEIDQLARQILAGQSVALIGIFDQERKDMLDVLRNSENFNKLYGSEANRLIFSYVDISTFTREHTPVVFWQRALMPLESVGSQQIQTLCKTCADNQYGDYYLEKLVEQLRQEGLRLVLMVHKFDLLLQLDSFRIDFLALLRRLASSRHPSAFVSVITMNMTINQLMSSNQIVGLMSSNLLSDVTEMILSPLPDKQIKPLLANGNFAEVASELTGNFPCLVFWFNNVLREIKSEIEPLTGEEAKLKFLQRVDRTIRDALDSHFFLTNGESLSLKALLSKLSEVPLEDKKELEKMGVLLKAEETYQLNPSLFNDFIKS